VSDRDFRPAIYDLMSDYAAFLDAEDYRGWLDLFADTCRYRILSRENVEQNLPGALVLCENKKALTDRVVALLMANQYSPYRSRHILGGVRLAGRDGALLRVEASYALYHSDIQGRPQLFSVGLYDDRIASVGGGVRFVDKTVVIDSFSIPDFLAKPI
jgi:anthranilate 1,2-dioxygenase small subunit